jgi:hypothetical protein
MHVLLLPLQDSRGHTPADVASCRDAEPEQVVQRLPKKPRLSLHVFKAFDSMEDDFVSQLLNAATNAGVVWTEDFQGWNDVFALFVEGRRSPEVFRVWLKIPVVRRFFEEEQPAVFCLVLGQYDTALHALSHLQRHDLISVLQEELSDNPDAGMVSGFHLPKL